MIKIISILSVLHPLLDKTTKKQLTIIIEAIFCMTGRITMLGISRWTRKGGSYRTINRFFKRKINWMKIFWSIIMTHLIEKYEPIILAGDTTIVTKSGKNTNGLGWFFSSTHNKALRCLSFQVISIISTKTGKSFPIAIEKLKYDPKKKDVELEIPKVKRGQGRPKGSKNKNRKEVVFSETLLQLKKMIEKVLELISSHSKPIYFVYDGAFGNNNAVQMVEQAGLHLISKLRHNSNLFFQFTGEYAGRGRPKIYGDKIDYFDIPAKHLVWSKSEETELIRHYRFIARHKRFADPLNIVVILKTDLKTKKTAKVILFSTDLNLSCEKMIRYYRLRFQIEFNFRDAKQHFGLEDFMVLSEESVSNATHLSFFCLNLSQVLMQKTGEQSIIDLKFRYHAHYYATQILKLISNQGSSIKKEELENHILDKIPRFGAIHQRKNVA